MAHSWSPELREELKDFKKFLRLMSVMDKNAGKVVPFNPTPEQLRLADILLNNKRVIILKARQIGASTIVRAYFTWKALLSEEPIHSGIMSLTHESASYLHSLDKDFVACLPKSIQRRLDASNGRSIRFKDTGAQLRSFTAGMKGGGTRSYALSDLHLSELAHYDNQEEVLSNAISTVGDGGQIVIETTANGPANVYHKLCTTSGTEWVLFFSPWHHHPAYTKKSLFGVGDCHPPSQEYLNVQKRLGLTKDQLYWRHMMIQTMGPDKFRQEYPSTIEEAFVATSHTWLLPSIFDEVEIRKGDGKEIMLVDDISFEPLVFGVDVASGNGGDYTVITAVSVSTGQPVWHWRCNEESPARFSERLLNLCIKYDVKKVCIESNGYGGIVLQRLRDLGFDEKKLWKNKDNKDFITTKESKLKILDHLKSLLDDKSIVTIASPLHKELLGMVNTKFCPRAGVGFHDDLVIATALAYEALQSIPILANSAQKENMMQNWIRTQRTKRLLSGDRLPWKRNTLTQ